MADIKDEHIDGLISELHANKSFSGLGPNADPEARAWNDAIDKAVRFIRAYRKGEGLFQL